MLPVPEANPGEERASSLVFVEVDVVGEERRGDVVERGQGGQEVETLEDEPDSAPVGGLFSAGQLCHLVVADDYAALVGRVHRADQVEQGRLARPGWPHDRDQRPRIRGEADAVEGGNDVAIGCITLGNRLNDCIRATPWMGFADQANGLLHAVSRDYRVTM